MPRTQLQMPSAKPVRATLPTKQYPHLRGLIKELDFACANCSSASGQPVYVTFEEAVKDPLRGPGNYTTAFALYCPDCHIPPMDGPFINQGMIDLLQIPKNYKKPKRVTVSSDASGLEMDEEESQGFEDVEAVEVPAKRPRTIQTKKKTTDLNPATRGRKAKGAVKAASQKVRNESSAF